MKTRLTLSSAVLCAVIPALVSATPPWLRPLADTSLLGSGGPPDQDWRKAVMMPLKQKVMEVQTEYDAAKAHSRSSSPSSADSLEALVNAYNALAKFEAWQAVLSDDEEATDQCKELLRSVLVELRRCEASELNADRMGSIRPLSGEMALQRGSFSRAAEEKKLLASLGKWRTSYEGMKRRLEAILKEYFRIQEASGNSLNMAPFLQSVRLVRKFRDAKEWDELISRSAAMRETAEKSMKKYSADIDRQFTICDALITEANEQAELEWERTHPEEARQKRLRELAERAAEAERRAIAAENTARQETERMRQEMEWKIREQEWQIQQAQQEAERASRRADRLQREQEWQQSQLRSQGWVP